MNIEAKIDTAVFDPVCRSVRDSVKDSARNTVENTISEYGY